LENEPLATPQADIEHWVQDLLTITDPTRREQALQQLPAAYRQRVRQRLVGRLACQSLRGLLTGRYGSRRPPLGNAGS